MNLELLILIFSILMLPGIAMNLFPGMPGHYYLFFIALIFGFVDSFKHLTVPNLIILALIACVAILVDFFAGFIGAKKGGADKMSLLGGFAGLIIGTFAIPIPILGSFIGFFLGIFVSELFQNKTKAKALKAATGGLVGALAGGIINAIIAVIFIVTFIVFALQ